MQEQRKILQKILAKVIKNHRMEDRKSISLLSAEIGMTKSILADLEKGIKDPRLSTLWRIAQGLNLSLSVIIQELEQTLGEDFSLID